MLLMKLNFDVSDQGELVVFKIAGFSCSLEFADALGLSALMRREAKFAKAASGDDRRRHNMMGVLSDASAPKWRQARWRKLPEMLRAKRLRVRSDGAIVVVSIGKQGMSLPYDAALQIAQALRVHGKLARNFANEKSSWARIAPEAAVH